MSEEKPPKNNVTSIFSKEEAEEESQVFELCCAEEGCKADHLNILQVGEDNLYILQCSDGHVQDGHYTWHDSDDEEDEY